MDGSRTIQLQLKRIRLDGDTQPRIEMDERLIAEYAENYRKGIVMPDPVVFYDGKFYWLASGFHRIHAMLQARIRWSSFVVFDGTARDAFLYAAGTNDRHGLRRRPEDVRKCVRRMLEDDEWGQWVNAEIARRCKCDPRVVSDEKRQLWEEAHPHSSRRRSEKSAPPKRRTYRTKHGTTSTMDTSKIGKAPYRERPVYQIDRAKDAEHYDKIQGMYDRAKKKDVRNAKQLGMTWEEYLADKRLVWDLIPVV